MGVSAAHVPLGQRAERYWVESRRPLASLVFIAPLLFVYEAGALLLGAQTGADAFMRRVLGSLGFGQHFLLPILLVCILLGWHYLSREPWRLSGSVVSAMAVESAMLGLCVWAIALVQDATLPMGVGAAYAAFKETCRSCVGYLGAGIYEELLFRLILLGLLSLALRKAGASPRWSTCCAVLLGSVLFAAAHYLGPAGEALQWRSFLFRTLAGVFFSVVFLYRGFGIAAGSHAAYDVLAGVLAGLSKA
jgi:membrane protease YdiL (CAAX protease family)